MNTGIVRCGLLLTMVMTLAGCNRGGLDGKVWKLSGSDTTRGIDHYYSKPSVKKIGEGVFTVTTKAMPIKGDKAVEEATSVPKTYAVATTMELGCKDKYVRVMVMDYQDKDGITLSVEKKEVTMEAVRPVTPEMPLFGMYQDLCK